MTGGERRVGPVSTPLEDQSNLMRSDPVLHHVPANDVSLAYYEWRADLRGVAPTLLMVHATGFHGRVWDPVIASFPNRHIIALEQRGHGRSQTSSVTDITDWVVFGRDLAAFAVALDLSEVIGIGHSMGSCALIQGAAFESKRFKQLILIDPTIFDPILYHGPKLTGDEQHPAARRMSRFDSPQAMIERFSDRPPYSWFSEEALRSYCEYALMPASDGLGFVLACHPATEASIYMSAQRSSGIFASVLALKIPVLLIRARLPAVGSVRDFTSSPTWPGLVSVFQNAREIYLDNRTHLVPMEDPALIARLIEDELAKSI
jgi:lipase